MSLDPMDIRLSAEQLRELALMVAHEMRQSGYPTPIVRPELTATEAIEYCGFATYRTFRRFCLRLKVRACSRGRYRKSALDRAMGGAS